MPEGHPTGPPVLRLADGSSWRIVAAEPEAAPVVTTLAAIMRLSPETGTERPLTAHDMTTRELRVIVRDGPEGQAPLETDGDGPVVVAVFPSSNQTMHALAVARIADAIARDTLHRGGLLVHGALAELNGRGVILAGAGTVGKSTASRRLPEPWCSWSDDATLVVRDCWGQLRAHPWPTWSRFYDDDDGNSWDVAASLPPDAVCFLEQAPADRVTPVSHSAQAVAMLMDCVNAVSLGMQRNLDAPRTRALLDEQLANAESVIRQVPSLTLELSLTGNFWTLLELLLDESSRAGAMSNGQQAPVLDESGRLVVTLRGTSMLPTLREPALLEVAGADGSPLRVGDVVCFRSPESGVIVVHRVVTIGQAGIRTRGDNCSAADPYILKPEDVVGRVIAARRGARRWRVLGGHSGRGVRSVAYLRQNANRALSPRLHAAYECAARTAAVQTVWAGLAPTRYRPRFARFKDGSHTITKALLAGREIGRLDRADQHWTIRRPFRLIISNQVLSLIRGVDRDRRKQHAH